MVIGAQAQVALEHGKTRFGPAEQDIESPQLLGAKLGTVRSQDITSQQLLVLGANLILALPSQSRPQIGGVFQPHLVEALHSRRPPQQLAQGTLHLGRVGQSPLLEPRVEPLQARYKTSLGATANGQLL